MPRLSRRLDLAVLVDLGVSCLVAGLSTWWWHQFRLGGLLFGGLVGVALMWRRHRPIRVLAFVVVLCVVVAPIEVRGTKLHEGMLLVSLAVAAHAVVAYAATLRAAVIGGVGAAIPAALLSFGTAFAPLLAFAAVISAAGLSIRLFQQQKIAAADQHLSAERERAHLTQIAVAEERVKIARELHDVVGHSLSVIILQGNGGEYAFDHDPDRAREALRTIGVTGRDALEEINALVQILRSDGDHGIAQDPATLSRITVVIERARDAGLAVDFVVEGRPPDVPGGIALAVHRIVQESLTNTLKHAGPAPSATVHLTYRHDGIEVEVTDTGSGGSPAAVGGHGLVGMRERAALYGGQFDAGPHLGGGWRVRARIPLVGQENAVSV